jgi:excisionase family DNA binding protein
MDRRFLKVGEVADYLGLSKNTVYSWVCQKRIPYFKVGRLVKFDRQKIDRWAETREVDSISDNRL